MSTELAGTIALCLCTRKPPAIAEVSAGTGRIVLRLLVPPSVKATLSRRQGVKASLERSRLAALRAAVPPTLLTTTTAAINEFPTGRNVRRRGSAGPVVPPTHHRSPRPPKSQKPSSSQSKPPSSQQ